MMDSKRLLLVSPRFWPVSGSLELLASGLAQELAELGHKVTVLTGGMDRVWPNSFEMGSVSVVRLPKRRDGFLDAWRLLKRRNAWSSDLYRWLSRHQEAFDYAIVISGPDEIGVTVDCLRRAGLPAIVRRDGICSRRSPAFLERSPNLSRRIRWVSASGQAAEDEYCVSICDGVADWRSIELSRQQIREALQTAHPLFQLGDRDLLAVCPVDLEAGNGVFELVDAWREILSQFPTARLWMTGEGVDGYELFQRIRDLEMEHAVILPGNFDEILDVLQAADAIIMPGKETPPGWYAGSARMLGVPVICHAANREICELIGESPVPRGNGNGNGKSGGIGSTGGLCALWMFDDTSGQLESVLLRWAETRTSDIERGRVGTGNAGPEKSEWSMDRNSLRQMARQYVTAGQSLRAQRC